ncbi:peptidase S8/S53 [Calothrix sp. NIES-4071]|nr:peptidase S8/S53 [Calothrix sp. NIES-4071]BAZ61704.1 peptidase S8/S53 [Calothrix sp. NIES-4105]
MTQNVNHNDSQLTGVPASSLGMILQRGGEELALRKVNDRFTIRPSRNLSARDLSQVNWGNWRRSIPGTNLEVFTVPSAQLDTAMQQARASSSVEFASHIYEIENNPGTAVYLGNQITIQFAPSIDAAKIKTITATLNLVEDKPVEGLANTFVFLVGPDATENPIKIANRLQKLTEVLVAEPNVIIRQEPHYRPRDTLYPQQWYLNNNGGHQLAPSSSIFVEQAWDITRGVRSVVVAIVDDSFDLNHPDFQGNGKVVAPRNLKDDNFLPLPGGTQSSHGTACAGVAVAEENGTGIVGVAPGCALMPIRTTGFLDDESIEEIFDWAVKKGASVISCSWGASAVYFPLSLRQRAAITRAATKGRSGKGCVILFAAGNANRPIDGTLNEKNWVKNVVYADTKWLSGFAIHPDVIAVAATTSLGKKAAYSNWGKSISVCAPSNNAPPGMWFQTTGYVYTTPPIAAALPGLGVLTTDQLGAAGYDKGDFTSDFGGTSSATPVVAGVAALILSANPNLTAQQVKKILQETADKIVDSDPDPQLGMREGRYDASGHSQWFGYGKVNAHRALRAAQQYKSATSAIKEITGKNENRLTIPDNDRQGMKSLIVITDSSLVKNIEIGINITHDFLGDLEIYLISPNNQRVLLQSRTLGRRRELQANYTIKKAPVLGQLIGTPASGRWFLWVIDYAPQDVGTLNSWELKLGT